MLQAVATYHDLVRRDVLPHVPQKAGRVLDFGGGMGATSAALRTEGRASSVVLFDQVAHEAVAGIDASEALDLEDTSALEAAIARHGPFDTILCLDILEHLRDPWAAMQLLDGALTPGGAIVISLPNANHYDLVGPLVLRGRFDYVDAGLLDHTHLRWFTRDSAIRLATVSGLQLETIRPNSPRRKDRLVRRLSLGLLERFVAAQYILRVRKA